METEVIETTACRHEHSQTFVENSPTGVGVQSTIRKTCKDCGKELFGLLPNGAHKSIVIVWVDTPPEKAPAPQVAGQRARDRNTNAQRVDPRQAIIDRIGGDGPGTRLALRFFDKGYHAACQACEDLAKQMNEWGSEECRKKMDYLVADILPRAEKWLEDTHKRANAFLDLVGNAVDVKTFALKNRIRAFIVEALDDWDGSQPKGND